MLVFLSWVFQNYFATQATEQRLRLERSQLAIDLQQSRMEQWHILYLQEKSKQEPDANTLTAASFKTLQSYLNVAAWSSVRLRENPADENADVQEKYKVHERLVTLYKSGNLEALEDDLRTVIALESQLRISDIFSDEFRKRYARVEEREKRLTWLFVFTYALGSVMIGADFMLKLRRDLTSPDRP